jgi:outer membrane protein assembly factor BamB
MFHVKQGWVGLLGLAFLGCLLLACGGAAGARGWAAPVPANNLLLVSTRDGRLDGLDATTRRRIWQFPQDWRIEDKSARNLDGIYGDPILSQDGQTVFVAGYSGYVYAFRPSEARPGLDDGDQESAASLKLSGPVIGGMALSPANDRLYVSSGHRVYSLSTTELIGRIENKDAAVDRRVLFEADGDLWGGPVLSEGNVLVASLDGNLYALDATTGNEEWRFTTDESLSSTPIAASGTVYVGSFGSRLHAVDANNGNDKWAFTAANWVWSQPLIESGRVYFGDFDGKLYAVEASSGSLVWSVDLKKGPIRATPVLAHGTLVVATSDGWIVGLDPASQSERWTRDAGRAINADLVVYQDSVLIAPDGCASLAESDNRVYYTSVDPLTGDLRAADGVC